MEFFEAKNNSITCKHNGVFLHSSYNPEAEAERFASSLEINFKPKAVIIIEPALSYCLQFLRKKFPQAKIGAIRLCSFFDDKNKNFDFVLYENDDLENELFDFLGEETILASAFFSWTPSSKVFSDEAFSVWKKIKAASEKARSVLATREYFSKKWFLNKVRFLIHAKNYYSIKKASKNILFTSSGPSLNDAIPVIKKYRNSLFVISLSSSISVLIHNKIIPDLCISTDGGWWAKKHLEPLSRPDITIPLAVPPEAAVPSCLLKDKPVCPLCYDDDLFSKEFFNAQGIPYITARRNGTVSGTALELSDSLTAARIFFAGLDMNCSKKASSFHSKPNMIDLMEESSDYFLRTKEKRISSSCASSKSGSMEIYKDWFKSISKNYSEKVFRIEGKKKFDERLGEIKDISIFDFEEICKKNPDNSKPEIYNTKKSYEKENKKIMKGLLEKYFSDEGFIHEIFACDYVLLERETDSAKIGAIKNRINSKKDALYKKAGSIAN